MTILAPNFSSIVIFKIHAGVPNEARVMRGSTVLWDGPAREEHNAFETRVVKEVIERPKATILRIRVRGQVWIITVDFTVFKADSIIQGCPKRWSNRSEFHSCNSHHLALDSTHHPLQRRLSGKLLWGGITEIVVWVESCVESRD